VWGRPPLTRSGRAPAVGAVESDPAVVGMQLDLESSFVDHDVMVEPTQDNQFSLVGAPTL